MDTGAPYNPFSSHRVGTRLGGYIFPEGQCLEDVMGLLEATGWRGELTGNHGAGKSTMLVDICERLRQRGLRVTWWQSSSAMRLPPRLWWRDIWNSDVIAYDGAERLLPGLLPLLRGLTRIMGRGLILTTHWRHGFGAVVEVKPNARALAQRFEVDKASVPWAEDDDQEWLAKIEESLKRHGGNSRMVWLDLYEEFEERYRQAHGQESPRRSDL